MKDYEFDYEYEDVDDEEEQEEEKLSEEDKWNLLQLSHLNQSTQKGMIDKGFPNLYKRFAITGWAIQVENGYKITELGKAHLMRYDRLLRKI